MESRTNIEALRLQIQNLRCHSLERRPFVPDRALKTTFTRQAIEKAVLELDCQPEDRIGLTNAIYLRGIITFAILIWAGHADRIVNFRNRDSLDSDHLSNSQVFQIAPDLGPDFISEYSWQFRPHFFRIGECVEISTNKILPFVRQIGEIVEGGFALVSKVELHHLQQDFCLGTNGPVVVIRKSLRREAPQNERKSLFDNERRCLQLLNCRNHPNVIPFYGGYKYGEEFCFLFPVLDMDLEKFFQSDKNYGDFQWDFTFFAALQGLSSALSFVHTVSLEEGTHGINFDGIGYHHDLRPANILVTHQTFVLADFGLGRLKPQQQKSNTPWKIGAGDYLAPECMNEDRIGQNVGRAIDVWAFGCLIAEVITFMRRGPSGLQVFCDARLSPDSSSNWATTYFHDSGGNMKESVRLWLDQLLPERTQPSVDDMIFQLICRVLQPMSTRPKMFSLVQSLSDLAVRVHYDAVLEGFDIVVKNRWRASEEETSSMKFWFEKERLKALGRILLFDTGYDDVKITDDTQVDQQKCISTLKELFYKLQEIIMRKHANSAPDNVDSETNQLEPSLLPLPTPGRLQNRAMNVIAADVQNSLDELWGLLTRLQAMRAENLWLQSMLESNRVNQLCSIEKALNSEDQQAYRRAASLALMKQLRIELALLAEKNASLEHDTPKPLLQEDVTLLQKLYDHQTGRFEGSIPVIVEWATYEESWENISPRERAITMNLKARGFGTRSKPDSLCILRCLGFYEHVEKDLPCTYGFLYQIPNDSFGQGSVPTSLSTLNELMCRSANIYSNPASNPGSDPNLNQPLLGDKFRLASTLADFVSEFHRIGWLHENLHSNNVVFFDTLTPRQCINPGSSKTITKPYILGLHKCRPGGESWHTQGPATTSDYQYYIHPEYERTRHFRRSYDYYTLGIVLLELGLWTPLSRWVKKHDRLNPSQFRNVLVKYYVPRLGPRMGSRYRDIVHILLADASDFVTALDTQAGEMKPDPENERCVLTKFSDEIALPLTLLSEASL